MNRCSLPRPLQRAPREIRHDTAASFRCSQSPSPSPRLAATPAAAEGIEPGIAATQVAVSGAFPTSVEAGTALVFENRGRSAARLMIPAGQAAAFACEADGATASHSRAGQYTLSAGASLHCTAAPGSYRFTAVSAEGGAVRERSGKLRVR